MREWIYGRNAVYEVLRAGRRQLFRLLLAQGVQQGGRLAEIQRLCTQRKVSIEQVPRSRLDSLGSNHQGLALEASGYPYTELADILDLAQQRGQPPFVLVLDTLQDPQNLGTLLRTAEIVGVHGVLFPLRHTATVTPAVVNASAGASEHLLVAQANLSQGIEKLKQSGVWVIGMADSPQAQAPEAIRLDGALAIVVGNEAEGIRPLVRASCDLLMRLPMRGRIDSYNAAVAGSIALFLAYQANARD
jgi:23S rRNA (guanosine2251-2'-O)-methyltransferase